MSTAPFTTLSEAQQVLSGMTGEESISTKQWPVYEMMVHCAQTIEYSMTGYPQMKPKIVRNTIGRIAIRKFLKQGYMKHSLTAHVPGAPKFEQQGTAREGIDLLLRTIAKFLAYQGPLVPHLLFGELSKEQYDQYFAMHIADHFTELQLTS